MSDLSERTPLAVVLALAGSVGIYALALGYWTPRTIQDDVRQFVFWMAEWRDEGLFRGDLIAEYWRSVSPWLFTAIYRAFDLIGFEPVTTARFLPLMLFPASGFFAFRLARTMTDDPKVAGFTAACILVALVVEDGVISATPRAFAPLFFLMFLDGLARRLLVQMTAGLFCLAGIYPHVAIVASTVLGLAFVDFTDKPRISLSGANLRFVATGAVAALVAVSPFILDGSPFGPTVTPETARQFAAFGPGGRTALVGPDGRIDFICGRRVGLVGGCDGLLSPVLWLIVAATVVGPSVLLLRYLRSGGRSGSAIPFAVGLASIVWFAVAAAVAFRLHVPNRFVLRHYFLLTALPYGLIIGEIFRDRVFSRLATGRRRAELATTVVGVAAFFTLVVLGTPRFFKTWEHGELAAFLSGLPKNAVIAGLVEDTDYVPLFARRPVLFSWEHAVGYHLGYYRQIERRMRDMLDVEMTPEASVLADRLARNAVDVYLIESKRLASPSISGRYARMLGNIVEEKEQDLGERPTALSGLAGRCRQGTFEGVEVLDARCLVAAAQSIQHLR